jgi:hypothetical protein
MHHGVGRGIGHAEFTNVFTSSAPPASAGQNSIACFASPLKLMYVRLEPAGHRNLLRLGCSPHHESADRHCRERAFGKYCNYLDLKNAPRAGSGPAVPGLASRRSWLGGRLHGRGGVRLWRRPRARSRCGLRRAGRGGCGPSRCRSEGADPGFAAGAPLDSMKERGLRSS